MKRLQVLLFNTYYSIQHNSFAHIEMVPSIVVYVLPIIQFSHSVKEFQILRFNTDSSIQHYSFFCTRLNGSNYCYAIQQLN